MLLGSAQSFVRDQAGVVVDRVESTRLSLRAA
jgi:hypothetical protein